MEGHTGNIYSVVFSSDGRRVLSASLDKTMRLWDTISGAHLNTILVSGPPHGTHLRCSSAAFSPDSALIASGSEDVNVGIWDAVSGAHLKNLEGHSGSVISVAFSPNGSKLVSGATDGAIWLWDKIGRAHSHLIIQSASDPVLCVVFSPNGDRILSGSKTGAVQLWSVATGALLRRFGKSLPLVHVPQEDLSISRPVIVRSYQSVAFSPDGTRIATSVGHNIELYDSIGEKRREILRGHVAEISSVVFSSSGTKIVSASDDCSIRIWDAISGAKMFALKGHTKGITSISLSPDDSLVVSGSEDRTIRLWNISHHAVPRSTRQTDCSLLSVLSSCFARTISKKRADSMSLDEQSGVSLLAFSLDATMVACTYGDMRLALWDAVTGAHIKTMTWDLGHVRRAIFSPAGTLIAVTSVGDLNIHLWDRVSGIFKTLEGHSQAVLSMAFSPDGTWIASGSADGTMRLWDTLVGMHLRTFDAPRKVIDILFSPNGTRIATVSAAAETRAPDSVQIWDAFTGVHLKTLKTTEQNSTKSVAFSPNGSYIISVSSASRGNKLILWDLSSGDSLRELKWHASPAVWMPFVVEHRSMVVENHAARIWAKCIFKGSGTVSRSKNIHRTPVADMNKIIRRPQHKVQLFHAGWLGLACVPSQTSLLDSCKYPRRLLCSKLPLCLGNKASRAGDY